MQAVTPVVPAVTVDAPTLDFAASWVNWDATLMVPPYVANAYVRAVDLPPPDLVIEFRNLRI